MIADTLMNFQPGASSSGIITHFSSILSLVFVCLRLKHPSWYVPFDISVWSKSLQVWVYPLLAPLRFATCTTPRCCVDGTGAFLPDKSLLSWCWLVIVNVPPREIIGFDYCVQNRLLCSVPAGIGSSELAKIVSRQKIKHFIGSSQSATNIDAFNSLNHFNSRLFIYWYWMMCSCDVFLTFTLVCFFREEDQGISLFWILSLQGFGFSCCWLTWQSAVCYFWWQGKYSAPHWHLEDLIRIGQPCNTIYIYYTILYIMQLVHQHVCSYETRDGVRVVGWNVVTRLTSFVGL